MNRLLIRISGIVVFTVLATFCFAPRAFTEVVAYRITAQVSYIDDPIVALPASGVNISVGDEAICTIEYDTSTPPDSTYYSPEYDGSGYFVPTIFRMRCTVADTYSADSATGSYQSVTVRNQKVLTPFLNDCDYASFWAAVCQGTEAYACVDGAWYTEIIEAMESWAGSCPDSSFVIGFLVKGPEAEVNLWDTTALPRLVPSNYEWSASLYLSIYCDFGVDYYVNLDLDVSEIDIAGDLLISNLIEQVLELNNTIGIPNSLDAKLSSALEALGDVRAKNDVSAINRLQACINEIEAQRGIHIPDADVDALIANAQGIIDALSLR